MPRLPRLAIPGHIHHTYARSLGQRRLFYQPEDYVRFLQRLEKLAKETDIRICSWVLLPDRFHLLLRVQETPLPTFMSRLLTSYAMYFNRAYQQSGPLFHNRYGSRIIQEEPFTHELIRYLVLEPVRLGVTHNPFAYPYSSLPEFFGHGNWKLVHVQEQKKIIGAKDSALKSFRKFLLDGLRMDLSEWDPFGDDREVIGTARFKTSRMKKHLQTDLGKHTHSHYNHVLKSLSARQKELLPLLAEGKTNSQIADSMLLHLRTVKREVSVLLRQFEQKRRTELVALLAREKILS